jgi:hypothetical protein
MYFLGHGWEGESQAAGNGLPVRLGMGLNCGLQAGFPARISARKRAGNEKEQPGQVCSHHDYESIVSAVM